jgi:hypothetical protein
MTTAEQAELITNENMQLLGQLRDEMNDAEDDYRRAMNHLDNIIAHISKRIGQRRLDEISRWISNLSVAAARYTAARTALKLNAAKYLGAVEMGMVQ